MINEKMYKIRKFQNGQRKSGEPFLNYSLTIPTIIARELPVDMKFHCELTEAGILFKPVDPDNNADNLPDWASNN